MKTGNLCLTMLAVVMMLCLAACQEKNAKLKAAIEQANKECPISAGEVGELTSFAYDDDTNAMVMTFSLNESLVKVGVLKEMPDQMKESAMAMVKSADGDVKSLVDQLKAAKSGMRIIYKGNKSGETVTLSLSYDELVAAESAPAEESTPEAFLESQVKLLKPQLPMKIEEGMSIVDINLKGIYLVYDVEVDEDMYSIEALNESKAEVKKSIVESLQSDASTKQLIAKCKKAGKGIAYCYKGNQSGNECLVKIKAGELD